MNNNNTKVICWLLGAIIVLLVCLIIQNYNTRNDILNESINSTKYLTEKLENFMSYVK